MKKILSVLILICIVISLNVIRPNRVFACSCSSPSIEQKYEEASVIFTGTLVSKDTEGGNIFSADKVWKGTLTDGYVYSGFNGMCGTEFEVGNKYLIYTFNSKGKETTSLCSGNKLITEASKEIQTLDRLSEPEWKYKYLLIFAFVFVVVILIMVWKMKGRFKKHPLS
ncbi:hypothetical protein [Paenibacillus sp. BK720]|uniref:hypothetical protein n=1 Tax=Paenibacillus sp. BK720 TaxID=2587092 RepID=UPI00141D757E|nr:hypothetical protein [Paenibacillus sp. BK720]NIK70786.1 hypothetical protein [Paenibacillus sp. BK720]